VEVKEWNQAEICSFAGSEILDVGRSWKVLEKILKFKLKGLYIMG
jgi:hypothetical protein